MPIITKENDDIPTLSSAVPIYAKALLFAVAILQQRVVCRAWTSTALTGRGSAKNGLGIAAFANAMGNC